jgi:hypothetical protein
MVDVSLVSQVTQTVDYTDGCAFQLLRIVLELFIGDGAPVRIHHQTGLHFVLAQRLCNLESCIATHRMPSQHKLTKINIVKQVQ